MKFLHRIATKSRQLGLSLNRNPIRNWLWLLVAAFFVRFLYMQFEPADYKDPSQLKNFYPWINGVPLMDHRNYYYLMGERFFDMVQWFFIYRVIKCWQTLVMWGLSVLYFFDYLISFHSFGFGRVYFIIMAIMFLPTIYRWIKR